MGYENTSTEEKRPNHRGPDALERTKKLFLKYKIIISQMVKLLSFCALFLPQIPELDVEVGDVVRINSGVFENYTGTITAIDAEKGRLKVLVEETPIDLGFDQVETI